MVRFRNLPSPALAVAFLALCVALSGTAYALTLPANSVGRKQIRKAAVLSLDSSASSSSGLVTGLASRFR